MKRLIVGIVVAAASVTFVGLAAPASATAPTKTPVTFSSSRTYPAGVICDFALRDTVTVTGTAVTYYNSAGQPVRSITHLSAAIRHTNLASGYYLTEVDRENSFDLGNGTGKTVGIQWHLRTPTGKNVLTVSGLITYQFDPFKIIHVTTHLAHYLDYGQILCPLLGGQPA